MSDIEIFDAGTDNLRPAMQADLDMALRASECGWLFRSIVRKIDKTDGVVGQPFDWAQYRDRLRRVHDFVSGI